MVRDAVPSSRDSYMVCRKVLIALVPCSYLIPVWTIIGDWSFYEDGVEEVSIFCPLRALWPVVFLIKPVISSSNKGHATRYLIL